MPAFHVPIIIFYGVQYLNLSVATAILLFYGVGAFSNVCEIPAGAFADRYGRRLSYFLGIGLLVSGYGLWLFQLPILALAGARLVAAVGDSLVSGTVDAMVYEEHHRRDELENYRKFKSHASRAFHGFRLVGMPIGALLFAIKPQLALVASIGSLLVCALACMFIPDNNVVPKEHTTISLMKSTISRAFANYNVRLLLITTFVMGFLGELFWRSFQPAYEELGLEVKYIGMFYAAFSFISFAITFFIQRISKTRQIYYLLIGGMLLTVVSLGSASVFPIIAVIALTQAANSIFFIMLEVPVPVYVQNQYERYQQSTILSVMSMTLMGGLAIAEIFEGGMLYFMTVRQTYIVMTAIAVIATLILAPALWKCARSFDPNETIEGDVVPPPIVSVPAQL